MSSFICEKCGKPILDTPHGYITGCEHYPVEWEIVCEAKGCWKEPKSHVIIDGEYILLCEKHLQEYKEDKP